MLPKRHPFDTPDVKSLSASVNPLRVLVVEDSPVDADVLVGELCRGGYEVIVERVESAEAMRRALRREQWHVVLSDYIMREFSAPEALAVLREFSPELPFIIVSGTIDEDLAVEAMRPAPTITSSNENLRCLGPAVERELRESANRRMQRAPGRLEGLRAPLRHAQKHGSHRPARRRHRPRFQQPAHRHPRLQRIPDRRAARGYADPSQRVGDPHGRAARDAAHQAAPGIQPAASARAPRERVVGTMSEMQSMIERLIGEDIQFSFGHAEPLQLVLMDRVSSSRSS